MWWLEKQHHSNISDSVNSVVHLILIYFRLETYKLKTCKHQTKQILHFVILATLEACKGESLNPHTSYQSRMDAIKDK